MRRTRRAALWLGVLTVVVSLTVAATLAGDVSRLPNLVPGGTERADWISREDGAVAFGAGRQVTILRPGAEHPGLHLSEPPSALPTRYDAQIAATHGLLLLDHLVLAGDGQVHVLDLNDPTDLWTPLEVEPALSGTVRLTRYKDDLLVSDAAGIRRFEAFRRHVHGADGHGVIDSDRRQIGFLATASPVLDVAYSLRNTWALFDGMLARVDLEDASAFSVLETRPVSGSAHALDLNGNYALLVGDEGIRWIDLADPAAPQIPLGKFRGTDVRVSGRMIELADGDRGIVRLNDTSQRMATVGVDVTNFSFQPAVASIQAGDTVRWENIIGNHNAEACDGVSDPVACGGQVAPQNFDSGAPSSTPWVYSFVFTATGAHPYFCVVHAGFGMTGRVDVAAAPANPPTVPDGQSGGEVTARKLDTSGTNVEVAFDDSTCTDNTDHQIVYGFGSQFPAAAGNPLTVAGSACGLGASSPATWTNVPDPATDSSRLLWFLVLSTDGGTTEGGWGSDSSGSFRGSAAVDGNSAQCGVTSRSLSNTCGQ